MEKFANEEAKKQLRPMKEIIEETEGPKYNLLKNPNLLNVVIKEIQDKRVVGEQRTVKCIFLVTNCRLVKNIKATSSNLNINDESGIGKDWIVKAVLDILPRDVVIYRTKITPELLTYWHNSKFEPDWTWNGKILYIEDISTNLLNSDVFKVFSSGGSKATVLIKQHPVDIVIDGKPSMIVTSYHVSPNNENLRRYPMCYCDSSDDQTLEIMIRQSQEDATGEKSDYEQIITDALGLLKRECVIVPYAEKIPKHFPKNKMMRTQFKRFLDFIKSSAVLYQFQRDRDENGNLIATGEDYNNARDILDYLTNKTREQDNILQFFNSSPGLWFSVNDIENKFPISSEWLRKQLKKLNEQDLLISRQIKREDSKRKVTEYCYNADNNIEIPLYNRIDEVSAFDTNNTINKTNKIDAITSINTINQEYIPVDRLIELNESNEVKFDKQALLDKILDVKKIISNNPENNYDVILEKYGQPFIDECLERGVFIESLLGKKLEFIGGK